MACWEGNRLRRCYSQVSLALIAYTALTQVTLLLVYLPYLLGDFELFFNDWYYYLSDAMVFYPVGFLIFGLMLRHLPIPRVEKSSTPRLGQILSCAVTALGVLYWSSTFTDLLLAQTETVDYANQAIAQEPLLFSLVSTVLLAPLCEELIFRRLLLDRLLFLGDWSALLISAFFFALFHTNLYQFFYAFTVGLILGYVRIMTGRVGWSILLHMFINFFCGVLPSYIPQAEWADVLLCLVVMGSMAYSVAFLLIQRPWRNLYSGPLPVTGGEKAKACFTSVTFWLCVAIHLGLSIYYIIP